MTGQTWNAAEMHQTNTLLIALNQVGSADEEMQRFGRFGEVASLEVLPEGSMVQVSFFDVRDACRTQALYSLQSRYGQQHGDRSVLLPGDHVLEDALALEVSSAVAAHDGHFWVEFYDTRKAELLRQRVAAKSQLRVDAPVFKPVPQKAMALKFSELSWEDLKNKREQRTSLHLRGLPRKLCMPGALEALISQNGLEDMVSGVRLLPQAAGARLGCAVLTARSVEEVPKLAKFFHGRQFGASAPVAVSFSVPSLKSTAVTLEQKRADAKIDLQQVATASLDTLVSITTISGSDSPRSSSSENVRSPISPPPGLELDLTLRAY